jgi:oligopeptide/dipeptide ABC transporter ATP-binding protein
MTPPLLRMDDVVKTFPLDDSVWARVFGTRTLIRAVDGVSLDIEEGETLALVGESGSGKSTLADLITGLQTPTSGAVRFDGTEVGSATDRDVSVRSDIGMVFQNPAGSLDPRMRVEGVVAEPMRARGYSEEERTDRVSDLLEKVNLSEAYRSRYPHELSGGEAQRIAIARAIALEPRLLVLDEPVSALDVSVQAKVLNLLMSLQRELGLTYLFIAHDLNVVEHIADRVAVMYLGRLMEVAPVDTLFDRPSHPYTETLLSAIPSIVPDERKDRILLGGDVPSAVDPPTGCVFHTRCPMADPVCRTDEPPAVSVDGAESWCHFAESFSNDSGQLSGGSADD